MKLLVLLIMLLPSTLFADDLVIKKRRISEPDATKIRSAFLIMYPIPDDWQQTSDKWITLKITENMQEYLNKVCDWYDNIPFEQQIKDIEKAKKDKPVNVIVPIEE